MTTIVHRPNHARCAGTVDWLGLSHLIITAASVAHPSLVGVEEGVDRLPVAAPMCSALDEVLAQRELIMQLSEAKAYHKALRQERQLHKAIMQLPPSLIYCLEQCAESERNPETVALHDADGGRAKTCAQAALAASQARLDECERILAASAPALKESRRAARATLAHELGKAAFLRRLQVRSEWPEVRLLGHAVDIRWNMASLDVVSTVDGHETGLDRRATYKFRRGLRACSALACQTVYEGSSKLKSHAVENRELNSCHGPAQAVQLFPRRGHWQPGSQGVSQVVAITARHATAASASCTLHVRRHPAF